MALSDVLAYFSADAGLNLASILGQMFTGTTGILLLVVIGLIIFLVIYKRRQM